MATFVHGKDATLELDDGTGTLVDLGQYLRNEGLNRSRDTHDVTTQGNDAHRFMAGLKNATFPLEGPWDATIDALLDGAYNDADPRPFKYWPAGKPAGGTPTATQPSYNGQALITSYDQSTAVDSDGGISADFQVDGEVTRAVA